MQSGQQTSNIVRHLRKRHGIEIVKNEDHSDVDNEGEYTQANLQNRKIWSNLLNVVNVDGFRKALIKWVVSY